ncbi:hypothetical protein ACWD7F_17095 [Streptomyces sp. NPDC005122]
MTSPLPRSPRLLLISALLLAATGVLVLSKPSRRSPDPPAATPGRTPIATATPSFPLPRFPRSAGASPQSSGASSPAATPNPKPTPVVLPPHGEGRAGDRAIQQALETAWPADLSPADERLLRIRGTSLLCADATGVGRSAWPKVFGDRNETVAPAFSAARFRVQAVIARQSGPADLAVVHLVWAGADRGGTFTDGRITDLHFIRTTVTKGVSTWSPQPLP